MIASGPCLPVSSLLPLSTSQVLKAVLIGFWSDMAEEHTQFLVVFLKFNQKNFLKWKNWMLFTYRKACCRKTKNMTSLELWN